MEENPKEQKEKSEPSLLEKSESIAKRIEEANKRAEEILSKNEQAVSRMILGGGTQAVQSPVQKEETPKEYKDRIMRGEK